MKIKSKTNLAFILLCLSSFGCGSVKETIELVSADIQSPIALPPTHVNIESHPGSVTFSPRINGGTKYNVESSSELSGKQIKLSNNTTLNVPQKNIQWHIPSYTVGADLSVKVSNNFALFGGINIPVSGQTYTGGYFGLGVFNIKDNIGLQFDIGLNFQNYNYQATTYVSIEVTNLWNKSKYYDNYYYVDRGDIVTSNWFSTLTLNSALPEQNLNYFISLGYFTQDLLNYEPKGNVDFISPLLGSYHRSDLRPDCKAGFVLVNPGISYKLSKSTTVLISLKLLKETLLNSVSNSIIIIPSIQMDFHL